VSLIVIGLSHRSAPMSLLEAAALTPEQTVRLGDLACAGEHVDEAVVVATCNRLEVYVSADTFHGAVAEVGAAIVESTGVDRARLSDHLYVHYEEGAIAHAFSVACGLDSMAVGEGQILGQMRGALRRGQDLGQAGSDLNGLFQQALRVGKRAHAETDLDKVSLSLVEAGLSHAESVLGPLGDQRVLVVGAGSMSGLAAATARRLGVSRILVANRSAARGRHLADAVGGRHVPMGELADALAGVDLVISCTGAVGHVLSRDLLEARQARCAGAPIFLLDLALPRDVEESAASIPGVHVLGLAELGEILAQREETSRDVQVVGDLIREEVNDYLTSRRTQHVGSTVAALRARAAEVVGVELDRLSTRLPDLTEQQHAEVRRTVHRVVEKLLHTPSVRVKELTGDGGGDYARALRELFDLDPQDVASVSLPEAPAGTR
jgi:glutamyl-tRNA reductase